MTLPDTNLRPVENNRVTGAPGSSASMFQGPPSSAQSRGLARQAVQDRFLFEDGRADNKGPSSNESRCMLSCAQSRLPALKRCSACGTFKSRHEFSVDRRAADGLNSRCKVCYNAYMRAYQAAHRAERKAADERHYAKHRDTILRRHRRWDAEHPLAVAARSAVSGAVHAGRLVKPDSCEQCGWSGLWLDAHHDDYTRPLSVRWLCRSCHRLLHYQEAPRA